MSYQIFFNAEAIANMDDDGIMLDIYDQMGDKQKATEKRLEKEKQKVLTHLGPRF